MPRRERRRKRRERRRHWQGEKFADLKVIENDSKVIATRKQADNSPTCASVRANLDFRPGFLAPAGIGQLFVR